MARTTNAKTTANRFCDTRFRPTFRRSYTTQWRVTSPYLQTPGPKTLRPRVRYIFPLGAFLGCCVPRHVGLFTAGLWGAFMAATAVPMKVTGALQ
jgi:hypothetical protein